MNIHSAPSEEPNGPQKRDQALSPSTRAKIVPFLEGTLDDTARKNFVLLLASSSELRTLIRGKRSEFYENSLPALTEGVCGLVSAMTNAMHGGNHLFPGNSFIAGIENRPDIPGQREQSYGKVREAAEALLSARVLEDLAFENIDRAANNIQAGRKAQQFFGEYSSIGGFAGATAAASRNFRAPKGIPVPEEPVHLDFKAPIHEGIAARLKRGVSTGSEARALCGELWELYPSYAEDKGYKYFRAWSAENAFTAVPEELRRTVRSDAGFRSELRNLLISPLQGTGIDKAQASRAVAMKLFMDDFEATHNSECLDVATSTFGGLLVTMNAGRMTKNSADLVEAYSRILCSAASRDAEAWNGIKDLLIDQLAAKNPLIYFQDDGRPEQSNDMLESLLFLGARIKEDPALAGTVKTLHTSALAVTKEYGVLAEESNALWAAHDYQRTQARRDELSKKMEKLRPQNESASEVLMGLRQVVNLLPGKDAVQANLDVVMGTDEGPYRWGLAYFVQLPPSELAALNLKEFKLGEKYAACTNLAQILEQRLVDAVPSFHDHKKRPPLFWDADTVPALLTVDKPRAKAALINILSHQAFKPHDDLLEIAELVAEHFKGDAGFHAPMATALRAVSGWSDGEKIEKAAALVGLSKEQTTQAILGVHGNWNEAQQEYIRRSEDPRFTPGLIRQACDTQCRPRERVLGIRTLKAFAEHIPVKDIPALAALLKESGRFSIGEFERNVAVDAEAVEVLVACAKLSSYSATVEALARLREDLSSGENTSDARLQLRSVTNTLQRIENPAGTLPVLSPGAAYSALLSQGLSLPLFEQYVRATAKESLSADEQITVQYVQRLLGELNEAQVRQYFIRQQLPQNAEAMKMVIGTYPDIAREPIEDLAFHRLSKRLSTIAMGIGAMPEMEPGTTAYRELSEELRKRGETILASRFFRLEPDHAAVAMGIFMRIGRLDVAEKIIESTELLNLTQRRMAVSIGKPGLDELPGAMSKALRAFMKELMSNGSAR